MLLDGRELSSTLFSITSIRLKDYLFRLSRAEIGVMDYQIHMASCRRGMFMSQRHIGNNVGITREWTNKCIRKLVDLGFLKKTYRHRKTCYYQIARSLFCRKNLKWLVRLFPSIYKLLTNQFTPNFKYLNLFNINKFYLQIMSQLGSNMFTANKTKTEKVNILLESIKNGTQLSPEMRKEFSGVIKCLGEFCLTQHGVISLIGFSNKVLDEALSRYQASNLLIIDNHFMLFLNLCEQISKESNDHQDLLLRKHVMATYRIATLKVFIGNRQQNNKNAKFLELNATKNLKREMQKQDNNRSSSLRCMSFRNNKNPIKTETNVARKKQTYYSTSSERAQRERDDKLIQKNNLAELFRQSKDLNDYLRKLKEYKIRNS